MESHYRVAIFGSVRIRPGDGEYEDLFRIAHGLAAAGFDIVTGGGPGLLASQKVHPTTLQRFFRTSTYYMYAFTPEKPLRLVGRNFCLAIT